MNFYQRFLRQPRVAASIALLVFSAFAVNAKTTHGPGSPASGEAVLSLADFNPAGDGTTDDGPALQRALDALAAAGGGTLLIPAGSYLIATPVVKDFSGVNGANIKIQGVPSDVMPAPVDAMGEQLAAGLNLTSEIIPATGDSNTAITITNLRQLSIEHVGFSGRPGYVTDAFITLYFTNVDKATIRHCEFYGLSTFGWLPDLRGGNVVRAERSELSIEQSVFLGCTGNSGAYAALVENVEWRKFSISNSIFLDYGLRAHYSKTGLGAPLSWINIGNAAATTPDSPRREIIVRDTFLDEGGWVGISSLPYRYTPWETPTDLIYISGLKMNVANMGTTGHLLYDARNLLIENSYYGWSINAYAALDINRFDNVILDKLTCTAHADRIFADEGTDRLTIINSTYTTLDSLAQTTTVLETAPEDDPVQYVRQQFSTLLARAPDPAAHFYWSDLLIRCGSNNECVNEKRAALSEYLHRNPQADFSLAGTVTDENGIAVSNASISLTGTQSLNVLTDSQGKFQISGLATSGNYTVAVNKRHYSLAKSTQSVVHPAGDVNLVFNAVLDRHSITGRVVRADGVGVSGVELQLAQAPEITATTDSNGFYSFPELAAGGNYTIVPTLDDYEFAPANTTFEDLSEDHVTNFAGTRMMFSLGGIVTDENGEPVSEAAVSLTGSKSSSAATDLQGNFMFSDLPTSGSYTVAVDKRHYTFVNSSQTFARPLDDVNVVFSARLNRHTIAGRLTRIDGSGMSGVMVQLAESPATIATTDANGFYSFAELMAGDSYTVVPLSNDFVFGPVNTTFNDLSANATANFVGKLQPELIMVEGSEFAVALDSVSFMTQPFSFFNPLGFSNDGFIRVTLFATNLEPVSGPSQVLVAAEDDDGQTHPLEVEFMGEVPGQNWLKQLNLKLPSNSLNGKCVQLKLTVAGVESNNGRVCLAASNSPK